MTNSYWRGHPIYFKNDSWFYSDTHEATAGNERPCGHCGKFTTKDGHDGCLGELPNIMNACCGHGVESDAYVQYWLGNSIHGKDALMIIDKIIT